MFHSIQLISVHKQSELDSDKTLPDLKWHTAGSTGAPHLKGLMRFILVTKTESCEKVGEILKWCAAAGRKEASLGVLLRE